MTVSNFSNSIQQPNQGLSFAEESLQRFVEIEYRINRFLYDFSFTSEGEENLKTENPENVRDFFVLVNSHFELVQQHHPDLALHLKIKLANLPVDENIINRANFKNICLGETEQSQILHDHFQNREAMELDLAIDQLKSHSITTKEAKFLVREVLPQSSRLCQTNRQKLINALSAQMGNQAPQNWNDAKQVEAALNQCFTINQPHTGNSPATALSALKCACIARKFFETSTNVPRWYYMTSDRNIEPTIKSGVIRVAHREAYPRAWVSSHPQYPMGDCVIAFRHHIAALDPNVFIGNEEKTVLWRGLHTTIPLVEHKPAGAGVISNIALVGLSPSCKKAQKANVVALLQENGIDHPVVVSTAAVDYIHREIFLKIGYPNLTQHWWGNASVSSVQHLDPPLPKQ